MLKNYITWMIIASIGLFSSSCSDSFLDTEPTEYMSGKQLKSSLKSNPDLAKGMVSGIYSTTFAVASGGHDDFGHKAMDIRTDMICGDMAMSNYSYGWFSDAYTLIAVTTPSSRLTSMSWRYYYKIIKSANEVIDGYGGNEAELPDDKSKAYYGQAKAMRGYAYYYLANLYGTYSSAPDAKCVPVYLTQLSKEPEPQSTTKEVLEQAVKDFTDAVTKLDGFKRSNKSEIDVFTAKGLLAYAQLTLGLNEEAAASAKYVIDKGKFTLMDSVKIIKSGFNDLSDKGWLWGIDLTIANSPALPTFWGHVDIFTYSYAYAGDRKMIDSGLYGTIPETDKRKKQFASYPNFGDFLPIWKFYDKDRKPAGNRRWDLDYVYLRIAEMYLIASEAYAQNGQLEESRLMLSELLNQRDPNKNISNLTKQELLDEIYWNWRVEMWGEGKSYHAMKRFKKTVTRGDNHKDYVGKSWEYNDPKLTYVIHESEINNNPYID